VGLLKTVGGSPGRFEAVSQVIVPRFVVLLNTRLRLVISVPVELIPKKHPSSGPLGRDSKPHCADEKETGNGVVSKM
jgi:hypothetical protein